MSRYPGAFFPAMRFVYYSPIVVGNEIICTVRLDRNPADRSDVRVLTITIAEPIVRLHYVPSEAEPMAKLFTTYDCHLLCAIGWVEADSPVPLPASWKRALVGLCDDKLRLALNVHRPNWRVSARYSGRIYRLLSPAGAIIATVHVHPMEDRIRPGDSAEWCVREAGMTVVEVPARQKLNVTCYHPINVELLRMAKKYMRPGELRLDQELEGPEAGEAPQPPGEPWTEAMENDLRDFLERALLGGDFVSACEQTLLD